MKEFGELSVKIQISLLNIQIIQKGKNLFGKMGYGFHNLNVVL